jgi:hypothetical protein
MSSPVTDDSTLRRLLPFVDDDDAPTLVLDRDELYARHAASSKEPPPPLPMPLLRIKHRGDDWIGELPEAARRVLESARRTVPSWPMAPRIPGAIAWPSPRVRPLKTAARPLERTTETEIPAS